MAAPTWVDFYTQLTANAQAASNNRASDPSAGISWSHDPNYYRNGGPSASSSGNGTSFMDRAWNNNQSVGKRILDILSRGNYASANFVKYQVDHPQEHPIPTGVLDPRNIIGGLGAAWRGLEGKDKTTYSDVLKDANHGDITGNDLLTLPSGAKWNPQKDLGTLAAFGLDVGLDPTTYIGAGAVKSGIKAVRGAVNAVKDTGKAAKITEAAVQPVVARAADQLATTGSATVPVKSADDFVRNVTRNVNNPGNVFNDVVSTAPTSTLPRNVERTFEVSPTGTITPIEKTPSVITNERFMLPGPSADVISSRAIMQHYDQLAKGIPQFDYGHAVDQLDETGPFNITKRQVPVNDVPQVRPVGTAAKAAAAGEWSDLPPVVNDNRIRNAIMRKNDERVFSEYEKFIDPATGVQSFRPAQTAFETTVGDLRRALTKLPRGSREYAQAKDILKNHLDAVEQYAKNLAAKGADATGYGTAEGYIKDMYPQEFEAARQALGGRAKPKTAGIEDLPPGPSEIAKAAEPTFKEITDIQKMGPVDKILYLDSLQKAGGLSKKDVSYLAQASNPKSFATRMRTIKNRVRDVGVADSKELIDAIDTGRIQSVDEPGIKEMMDATGAKSLKGLSKKLKEADARRVKAEQAMLGRVAENPITKESRSAENVVKELGPTGLPYSPYAGRAAGALEKANEIIAQKVEPAAKIVQDAKAGDKAALTRPKSTLNAPQSKIFDNAMKWAVEHEVIKPRDKALWQFVTNRGTLRTSRIVNKGAGRNAGAWNKYSQYTFFKNMMQNAETMDPQIKQLLNDAGVRGADRGAARATAMHEIMMPVLKAMDDVLKQGGVFPVAGKAIGDNPFSLFDVLHALPPEFVKDHIFTLRNTKAGAMSKIAPTQLMDVFNYLVDVTKSGSAVGPDDIETVKSMLMEVQKTRNGRDVPNGLRQIVDRMKDPADKARYLDNIVADIADALPEVAARTERNLAERKLWHEEQVTKGTKAALETLADTIADPTVSPGDIAGLASKVKVKVVDKVTRLNGIDPNDAWMAGNEVQAKLPELGMPPEVQAMGHVINQMAEATTKAGKLKAGRASTKLAEEESAKLAEELGVPLSDLGTRIEQSMGWKLLKAFSPHLGNADVRPYFLDRKSLTQNLGRGYQALISGINANHSKQAILTAWKEAQNGTRSAIPEVAKAQDDLQQAINTFFSKDPEYNVFARNNITPEDVNAHFAHFKIHEKFRFSAAEDMNDAWKSWDTDNPLDLLAKVQAATMAAMSKRLLGDDLAYRFGSEVQKAGYVKLSSHNSILAKYLDLNLYYHKDIARQFKVLDDFLKQSMEPAKFNEMTNFLDNVLHSYKAGLTIYRPGHHVRNMVGDVWLAHMAGVNNPKYYTKAAKIMAQNHGRYQDFDAIQALMARQPVDVKPGKFVDDGSPIVTVRAGGKQYKMTAGDVYRTAYDRGILNDYRTLEDIQMGTEGISDKLRQISPFKGKLNKAASSFSEARDHYVRLAHFMSDLETGKFSSIEEAVSKSAQNVRKWHPDGSDLTRFESNVMRRTFLFYSWIRKAMPLVVESMVMHPGKVMIYPKAMYNIAEANGIDLESMSNPFPQDQLFPDWITDSPIGPFAKTDQGHYLTANPGVPFVDVLNDYGGAQAGRTAEGSLNPFIKIPLELINAQGTPAIAVDSRSGVKSYDATDYIDRQIPFGTYMAGLTGKSPSSGFTQNKGNKQQGTPNPYALDSLLSGLGISDISKPGYQKQATKDAKARLKQQMGVK